MTTIETIYQEIAGNAPDRESVARIRRAGRLLNLSETDSGWLLLAVLAAHGSLAQANLQTAATLAASLSIAADEAKATTQALTRASNTATAAIVEATDEATPAFTGAIATAVGRVAGELNSIQGNLLKTIQAIDAEMNDALASRVGAMGRAVGQATDIAASNAAHKLGTTVNAALGEAIETIRNASADLKNGASAAREATVEHWRSEVVKAVTSTLSSQSLVETEDAKRRTIRTAALTSGLIAILIAGVGFGAHRIGWQDGKQYGVGKTLAQVHDQKIRASWANTPDGQLAYALYQGGDIAEVATCNAPGWKIETTLLGPVCLPYPAKDGSINGWYLKLSSR
jgi:hypothetical protein